MQFTAGDGKKKRRNILSAVADDKEISTNYKNCFVNPIIERKYLIWFIAVFTVFPKKIVSVVFWQFLKRTGAEYGIY